ncbi:MAG TPA: hypothetical protein EYO97_13715 [Gemmatimonadetes bacterium]|nr:hypothetical protein [Gemmatimonadota bacterium]
MKTCQTLVKIARGPVAPDRNRLPRPRKRFGQHFLRDTATIRRIVESIRVEDRAPVVEIGPGRGALTAPLAEHCNQLHLIEIDRDLSERLAETLSDLAPSIAVLHRIGFELVGDGSEPGVIRFEHRTPLGA